MVRNPALIAFVIATLEENCQLSLKALTVSPGIEPGYIAFSSHKNDV
jgi:hypothetical protein